MIQEKPTEVVPFPEKPIGSPRIAPAEVIVVQNGMVTVSFGVQQADVQLAILDYDPTPGDRVLVVGDQESGYFAIGVLATVRPRPKLKIESSATSNATVLSVENGDLELVAPRGAVRIVSSLGVDATTMGPIHLKSRVGVSLSILDRVSRTLRRLSLTRRAVDVHHDQVDITAGQLQVTTQRASINAQDAKVDVGSLSLAAKRVSSELGTLLSKVENAYQRVADLWQLTAKRTRMVVDETSHHQAQRLYSKAEDVKIKADKIHLG